MASGSPNAPKRFSGPPDLAAGRQRILFADDTAFTREIAKSLLEKAGYDVDLAADGEEAVTRTILSTEDRYILVLLDLNMPGLSGLAAARLISDALPHVPIVGMSASMTEKKRQACQQAGMRELIAKPITSGKVRSLVEPGRHGDQGCTPPFPSGRMRSEDSDWNIPGVNSLDGLLRMDSDPSLFLRALKDFVRFTEGKGNQILDASSAGRIVEVAHLAHAVNGAAAAVSADGLSAAACDLERIALDETSDGLRPACMRVATLLAKVRTGIQERLPAVTEQPSTMGPPALRSTSIDTMVDRLDELLANNDMEASDCLDRILASTQEGSFYSDYRRMADLVENLDFKGARSCLSALRKSYAREHP